MNMHVTTPVSVKPVSLKSRSRRIIEWVAKRYKVRASAIVGPSRLPRLVHPRWIAMNLVWQHPETRRISLERIGRAFGNRDHTSVRHAIISMRGTQRFQAGMREKTAMRRADRRRTDQILKAESALRALARKRSSPEAVALDRDIENVVRRKFVHGETCKALGQAYGVSDRLVGCRLQRCLKSALEGSEHELAVLARATGRDPLEFLEQIRGRFPTLRDIGRASQ